MLRASSLTTQTEVDLNAVNGDLSAAAIGLEYGPELVEFAEAVASGDKDKLNQSRQTLLDHAGAETLVDSAGVAANFQRMVRIADSMGIPVDDMETELGKSVRSELNLTRFASAANTLNA
ncbi:MAG: hypothetical protein GKR91_14820 [Pseudomonadales bacterium]|nr:hypothetical protein [Pseudomonadales bacterium]